MKLALILLLLIILANALILDKALTVLSPKELKRRARSRQDQRAVAVYAMRSYDTLPLLLWIKGSLAAAILIIIFAGISWLGAIIFALLLAFLILAWQPLPVTDSWIWSWAAAVSGPVVYVMSRLNPVLVRLKKFSTRRQMRTDVYQKDDLLDFIDAQAAQPENRIPKTDLRLAFNALTFGDKMVSAVMTPLRAAKLVAQNDEVGPLLMDELHKSGFSRFPVIKEDGENSASEIVGTLYLKDLVGHSSKGKVKELMQKKIYYVNETSDLRGVLDAFLKTHHHLFVVVNNFEEITGIITIEDVLEQIIGKEIVDEFDRYDDLRAVAERAAEEEHKRHNDHLEIEEPAETEPEVPADPENQ